MYIVICGSLNSSRDEIIKLSNMINDSININAMDPIISAKQVDNNCNLKSAALYDYQAVYCNHLKSADLVLAVAKPDGTFGESTSYEIAICREILGIPVIEIYPKPENKSYMQTGPIPGPLSEKRCCCDDY